MPAYRQLGSLPRKHHIEHRAQPGYRGEGIHYEEVVTTAGFGRAYSIVYHLRLRLVSARSRPPPRCPSRSPTSRYCDTTT